MIFQVDHESLFEEAQPKKIKAGSSIKMEDWN